MTYNQAHQSPSLTTTQSEKYCGPPVGWFFGDEGLELSTALLRLSTFCYYFHLTQSEVFFHLCIEYSEPVRSCPAPALQESFANLLPPNPFS